MAFLLKYNRLTSLFLKGLMPLAPVFSTSILSIYRNINAQYNIINSVLSVVFQIHTCFIVLREFFIGLRSSGQDQVAGHFISATGTFGDRIPAPSNGEGEFNSMSIRTYYVRTDAALYELRLRP